MSLNKFTDAELGKELNLKIGCVEVDCEDMICTNMVVESVEFPEGGDLKAHDLTVDNNLNVTAIDESVVNYKTPDSGQPNYVLTTDGVGSVFFAPPNTGSSDITYNGTPPVVIGQHMKFSSTDASTANQSVLTETGTELNAGSLDFKTTGDVDCNTLNYTSLNPPIPFTEIPQSYYNNTSASSVFNASTFQPSDTTCLHDWRLYVPDLDHILIGTGRVGQNGAQYSENGGKTWSTATFDIASTSAGDTVYDSINKRIVFMNSTQIYFSTDGKNFIRQADGIPPWQIGAVFAYIPELSLYIRSTTNIGFTMETSTDGVTYTPRVSTENARDIVYAGGNLITTSDSGFIMYSSDGGITWNNTAYNPPCRQLAYLPDLKRVLAFPSSGDGSIWSSDDYGLTWTQNVGAINNIAGCRIVKYVEKFKQVIFAQKVNTNLALGFTTDGTTSTISDLQIAVGGGVELYGMDFSEKWGVAVGYNATANHPYSWGYSQTNVRNTYDIINQLRHIITQLDGLTIWGKAYVGLRPIMTGGFSATGIESIGPSDNTEQNLIPTGVGSLVVSANSMEVGASSTWVGGGNVLSHDNNEPLTFRLKINGITVSTFVVDIDTILGTPEAWRLDSHTTVKSTGVSGTIQINTLFTYVKDNLDSKGSGSHNLVTVDTTINNTFSMTAQWTNSDAGNVCVCDLFNTTNIYFP